MSPQQLAGSRCVVGCGRKLHTGAHSDMCITCRAWFYGKKKKTRGELHAYKTKVNLARARLEFVNEDNPKLTVTNGTHKVPVALRTNTLIRERSYANGSATAAH